MKQLNKKADNSIDSIIVNFKLSKQYYDKTDCLKLFNAVKPGGHVLLFAKTDIQYMTGINARLAGFDIRDTIYLPANNVNIIVARKPLSESTVASNTLKWGTGGLNIDASRIAGEVPSVPQPSLRPNGNDTGHALGAGTGRSGVMSQATGRFPANIILDENAAELLDEQSGVSKSVSAKMPLPKGHSFAGDRYTDKGNSEVSTERGHNDSGGASRFFYKAYNNKQLLTYLETLITPLNGKCIKIG